LKWTVWSLIWIEKESEQTIVKDCYSYNYLFLFFKTINMPRKSKKNIPLEKVSEEIEEEKT